MHPPTTTTLTTTLPHLFLQIGSTVSSLATIYDNGYGVDVGSEHDVNGDGDGDSYSNSDSDSHDHDHDHGHGYGNGDV